MALAQRFPGVFAARDAVGNSETTMGPCIRSVIADLVPCEKLSRAMSVYSTGIGDMAGLRIVGDVLLGPLKAMAPGIGLIRDGRMAFVLCGVSGPIGLRAGR